MSRDARGFDPRARFVTGSARFSDDDRPPRRCHAVFARCPHSHARIDGIDVRRALATPGVLGIWTGEDLAKAGVSALPPLWTVPGFEAARRPALATGRVRHVGEAVAVIVAESAHVARDAADRVEVAYTPVPAVGDVRAALAPGAPTVHDHMRTNVAIDWMAGSDDDVRAAFAAAAHIVEQRITIPRLAAVPLEPGACTATWDPATGTLSLHAPLQSPHIARGVLAEVLGIPEPHIDVWSGDVGGAFGTRISPSPEEIAVCFAAMQIGRPVRWVADRREAFHSDAQGRDSEIDAALAFDEHHRVTGLRLRTVANLGAYATSIAPALPTIMFTAALPGPYAIGAWSADVIVTYTNTVPAGALRGAGRQEACLALERMFDIAAQRFGINAIDLRRMNLDPATDNGRRAAAALTSVARFAEQHGAQTRSQGKHAGKGRRGIGVALYVDACAPGGDTAIGAGTGIGLHARAEVRVEPDGAVTVVTDAPDQGQNRQAMFKGIVAAVLGVAARDVAVRGGNSMDAPAGAGSLLGRGATLHARAVRDAALEVRWAALRIAARALGEVETAIAWEGGRFQAGGRSIDWRDVAALAHASSRPPYGLSATAVAEAGSWSRTIGAHCAIVHVDPDTGNTELTGYLAVDDVGALDAAGVRGMLEGGIAQGIGQALLERIAYDENGQLLTTSFMDYALPRFDSIPDVHVEPTVRSLDVSDAQWAAHSAAAAGAIAAPAAILNAVLAAVAPLGVTHLDVSLTPARIWEAIKAADGGA